MSWLLSPTTVWDLVEQRAAATPDRTALLDEHGVVLTWTGPERLEVLDELPKTGLGKVSKQAMRTQLSGAEPVLG